MLFDKTVRAGSRTGLLASEPHRADGGRPSGSLGAGSRTVQLSGGRLVCSRPLAGFALAERKLRAAWGQSPRAPVGEANATTPGREDFAPATRRTFPHRGERKADARVRSARELASLGAGLGAVGWSHPARGRTDVRGTKGGRSGSLGAPVRRPEVGATGGSWHQCAIAPDTGGKPPVAPGRMSSGSVGGTAGRGPGRGTGITSVAGGTDGSTPRVGGSGSPDPGPGCI